ncbi:MAG TPA: phytase [Methylophaga sp.]|nr:phytase [Methylophaga sp.]
MNERLKKTSTILLSCFAAISATTVLADSDLQRVGQQLEHKIEASQLLENIDFMPDADRVTAYKHKGIAVENKDGKQLSLIKGDFGSIDHRLVKNGLLLATVDTKNQQALVTVFNKRTKEWTNLQRIPKTNFKIEGVCLYQDSVKNGFLFLIGEEGQGQQWLVADSANSLKQAKLIRNLSTPPNSEFCQVDDAASLLFVNEEKVGIWAYDAHAEADLVRNPVALAQPFGKIKSSALGMQLIPNGLLVIDEQAKDLQVYTEQAKQWSLKSVYSLAALNSPKNVSTLINKDKLDIAIQHDDGLVFYTLPWIEKATKSISIIPSVMPEVETDAVPSLGDAADDPAIWVNQQFPEQSRVLVTNKQGGLLVYDMVGKLKQSLPVGRINNVDIRTGFNFNHHPIDLAVASNRDNNTLQAFAIEPSTGEVSELGEIDTTLDDIYGLCMYKNTRGDIYTIVNDKDGRFIQYHMKVTKGQISADLVREFNVDTQPEGCVADDANNRLFIGEENVAVWTLDARADASTKMMKVMSVGKNLKADIEGISLYQGTKERYLVISSQGNNSYVITDALPPFTYRGAFQVGINPAAGIDGASETDGLDVTSVNLGGVWNQGMLVVQDGRNRMPEQNQNFKYIPWSRIASQLKLNRY